MATFQTVLPSACRNPGIGKQDYLSGREKYSSLQFQMTITSGFQICAKFFITREMFENRAENIGATFPCVAMGNPHVMPSRYEVWTKSDV
jgi:hypothetical protein